MVLVHVISESFEMWILCEHLHTDSKSAREITYIWFQVED